MNLKRVHFLVVALVLISSILLFYSPSFHYDFIGLDDDDYVIRNPNIKMLKWDRVLGLLNRTYGTLYMPVTMFSYMVDYQIWRLDPFGYRFVNIVLHFLNSFLVFYLVWLINRNFLIAIGTALFFALHPVQIESVVWAAERKNVLSTFLLFLSIVFYWKSMQIDSGKKSQKLLLWSVLIYLIALLAKPSVIVFIPLIILIDYFFKNSGFKIRNRWWFYILVLSFTILAGVGAIMGTSADVEKYEFHGGSYATNIFVMLTVFWRYWKLILFPYEQNILYSSVAFQSFWTSQVWISAGGILLFFSLIYFLWRRQKIVAFWLSWFFVCFLPMSNLLAPFPSIMNDRYLYIPIIGFFAALFSGVHYVTKGFLFHDQGKFASKFITGCIFLSILIPFILIGTDRLRDWYDRDTLWISAFERSPRKDPRIYYYYGLRQVDRGNFEDAIKLLKEALTLEKTIDTELALGTAYVANSQYELAEKHLRNVLRDDPRRFGAYDQLAVAYRKQKRLTGAEALFKKAIELAPRNAVIYNNYALFLLDANKPEEAKKAWDRALELDPDCHFALRNLAWLYYSNGDLQTAAHYLVRYLRRDPTDKQMRNMASDIQTKLDLQANLNMAK